MLSKVYSKNVNNRSVIRECFEYSKQRAAVVGSENVFDFSIGNPNVPPPAILSKTVEESTEKLSPVEGRRGYSCHQKGHCRVS